VVKINKCYAKNKLLQYPFPGNIRELKAIIDLAAVMCDNNEIKAADITFSSTRKGGTFVMEGKVYLVGGRSGADNNILL